MRSESIIATTVSRIFRLNGLKADLKGNADQMIPVGTNRKTMITVKERPKKRTSPQREIKPSRVIPLLKTAHPPKRVCLPRTMNNPS